MKHSVSKFQKLETVQVFGDINLSVVKLSVITEVEDNKIQIIASFNFLLFVVSNLDWLTCLRF